MGDPRKQRKKYTTPRILWNKENIDEEKEIKKEYGVRNKHEIWRMRSMLSRFKEDAKKLSALTTKQAELEKKQLLKKLQDYKLIPATAQLDEVLGLELKDILERRLQTVIFKQGLARSPKQARQFITHGHVMVAGKKITSPSLMITEAEQTQITFAQGSALGDNEHPERVILEKKEEKKEDDDKKKGKDDRKKKDDKRKPKKDDRKSAKKPAPKKESRKAAPKKEEKFEEKSE